MCQSQDNHPYPSEDDNIGDERWTLVGRAASDVVSVIM